MPFELLVAIRYLRSRRKQVVLSVITAIAVGAVAVGVAALILVMALMTGFREDMQSKILAGTAHLNLVRADGLPIRDYRVLVEQVSAVPHVTSATPTLYQTVLLQGSRGAAGAILKGAETDDPRHTSEVARMMHEGDAAALATIDLGPAGEPIDTVILGKDLADEIGVKIGGIATALIPGADVIGDRIVPRAKDLRVVGIFSSGLYDYDSRWAYVSLGAARRLTGDSEVVQVVQMQVDDIHAVKAIAADVLSLAGDAYKTRDWQELNEPLYAALSLERLGFFIVLVVVVTIASLNIITLLTLMVMEKTVDIGILKTMGATDAAIMRIFVCQGVAIGAVGAALGLATGSLLVWYFNAYEVIRLPADVYSISHVTFRLRVLDVVTVGLATIVISLVSTIYPALSAAKLDPVEALRHE
ncbi:MAG: ABC transporter permease [Blastocatellia bacterium]|jgi:lipoprotein-releasing system permease protein|nr:ABC transporter permease [Blastocatellia bacterium]